MIVTIQFDAMTVIFYDRWKQNRVTLVVWNGETVSGTLDQLIAALERVVHERNVLLE